MVDYEILTDRQVLHRADTRGIVVTQVQTIRVEGRLFEVKFWRDWETGSLQRVDSVEKK